MNRNWAFGRKIATGFAVSSALLIAIGCVAYRSFDSLVATSAALTHAHRVKEEIATLLSLLKDAETGQRGYVITEIGRASCRERVLNLV